MDLDEHSSIAHDEVLLDGSTVTIRPIELSDSAALNDFHERCSDQTHYRRFFSSIKHLRPDMLDRFVNVDHDDREALVAVLDDRIIAVARYDRLAERSAAEVAFVVEDEHQRKGLASKLLHQLADLAVARAIVNFRAETLGENTAMQHVFRHSGYPVNSNRHADDPSVIEFSMAIGNMNASPVRVVMVPPAGR